MLKYENYDMFSRNPICVTQEHDTDRGSLCGPVVILMRAPVIVLERKLSNNHFFK